MRVLRAEVIGMALIVSGVLVCASAWFEVKRRDVFEFRQGTLTNYPSVVQMAWDVPLFSSLPYVVDSQGHIFHRVRWSLRIQRRGETPTAETP